VFLLFTQAAIPKATKIDLSNNELVNVSPSFAKSLSHVTKIDLSSNKLQGLPKNFGSLKQLKHLDLYNNQLTDLPVELSTLQNLRYIDVKNNPLRPDLAKAAGNCLDIKECQAAAKRLLHHLGKLKQAEDRENTLRDQKEKEVEMAKRRQEEEVLAREKERKKAEKKAAKEKRRLILETKQSAQENGVVTARNGKAPPAKKEVEKKQPTVAKEVLKTARKNSNEGKAQNKWSWLGLLNVFLLLGVLVAACLCAVLYAEGDLSVEGLKAAWPRARRNSLLLWNITNEELKFAHLKTRAEALWKALRPFAIKAQEILVISLNALRAWSLSAYASLEKVTGDLSPYLAGLRPLWDSFCSNVVWVAKLAWEWLSSLDWCCVVGGVKQALTFLADQVRVANAEFWSNEAVNNAWKDLKPFREAVWSNTETIRHVLALCWTDFHTYWVPFIKQQSYDIYIYGKHSIESLIT
ncbi:UNVERIFIED_CONTAM: hypothetical protein GTU68_001119, partial [Idotea baltica]|nr:hypothetical protein [Idotea baltica]